MTPAALLNHLWQSTALAAGIVAVACGLRQHQARVRFGLWLAASVKFLVPFGALVAVARWLPWTAPASAVNSAAVAAVQPVAQAVSNPFGTYTVAFGSSNGGHAGNPLATEFLLGLWAAGAMLLLARWIWRWLTLARIVRRGEQREIDGLRVTVCERELEPGVFGILRPVVLLPRGLERRLNQDEFAAVLAHERTHVRRRDNLGGAIHGMVECLFWFHPGVWWLGRKLVEERERACDEAVLEAGGNREAYARGIVRVCRYYAEMPAACGAGVSGGGLRERVAGILHGGWGASLGARQKAMLWGLGAAVVAIPLAAGLLFAQSAGPKEFDAASVRIARVPTDGIPLRFQVDPQRLTIENVSLGVTLMRAYNLKPYQLQAPGWMYGNHLDLNAETATPVSSDRMIALLQPFLVKQFGLKYHWTTKSTDIYRLEVVKGNLKIKPSTPGKTQPVLLSINMGTKTMRFTGSEDMAALATMLSQQMGRPVVDDTGLKGSYDLDLSFRGNMTNLGGGTPMFLPGQGDFNIHVSGPGRRGPKQRAAAVAATAATQLPSPPLSAALPEELGLRLVAAKGPIKTLVIDSANRMPLGN